MLLYSTATRRRQQGERSHIRWPPKWQGLIHQDEIVHVFCAATGLHLIGKAQGGAALCVDVDSRHGFIVRKPAPGMASRFRQDPVLL